MSRTADADFSDHIKMAAATILRAGLGPEKFAGAMRTLTALADVITALTAAQEEALKSKHFTRAGIEERIRELKAGAAKKVAEWALGLDGLRKNIAQNEARLVLQAPSGDQLLAFFREKELRDKLDSMSEVERGTLYLAAARDGSDPLLEASIESAPRLFPLVSQAVLAEGRAARAQRFHPEVAAELKELQLMMKEFVGYLDWAKNLTEVNSDDVTYRDLIAGAATKEA